MDDIQIIADKLNILIKFLSLRDVPELTHDALKDRYGIKEADLLILFGGSIIHGCRLAAEAYSRGIAKKLMIVGGEGHTTDTLRDMIHRSHPEFQTKNKSEAECIAYLMLKEYGITDAILEKESTNCGNNVTNALHVVEEQKLDLHYVIIMQDSTMQHRMDAGLKKEWKHKAIEFIHYAPYVAKVIVKNQNLAFEDNDIEGMWSMDHFITLLLGEIPRLADNENGYGPSGKNFIAHVDIPDEVLTAFEYLKTHYSDHVREANNKWKS